MLAIDARTFKAAYEQENKTRLADSSNYNYTINKLESSLYEARDALRIEQATPKTIVKSNPDWWKFALGGSAFTAVAYFILKIFVFKK